ncbi:CpaF family protein [Nitrosomonas sp. Is35]|uniref:CpaF family protein n=1 Tax=unclassified Nitrosomonas TaxID=2609265 RepID=UPI00294B2FD7|nr:MULTISPECIES: CpaF family protein [unclassified Nitrosomonas]MDV6342315.1 CpaF family protein [Nitrosomonas sp. Is24]MDV6348218.1 CpaF family protein [Nitrosomonas sp. Is35]
MSIRDRLQRWGESDTAVPEQVFVMEDSLKLEKSSFHELKSRIHQKLLDRVDLSVMEKLPPDRLTNELRTLVEQLLIEEKIPINLTERGSLVSDIQHEILGLGPLEPLLADPTISDILVNTYKQVYVERRGKLELTGAHFADNRHLLRIIDRIVSRIGRRVDESSPMVDARLPDGSRVNAIIPPLALDGPLLSIRRFPVSPLKIDDLIQNKSLTPAMAEVIAGLVKSKCNLLISGGTGSGKTTLLNIMSGFIPATERIVTIEDAAELQLQQPHVVRLETRPPNVEGKGEVTQRALVRNSLRMRPDRIIIGEVRGSEAMDMLQAMNTGHEGSMTTVHANTPRDAVSRIENMVNMAETNLPAKAVRQQISSAIWVVVQVSRMSDGKRKLISLQEITGMEGDIITMQEIFTYTQMGVDNNGMIQGHFHATGVRPKFAERLKVFGVSLRDELFDPDRIFK